MRLLAVCGTGGHLLSWASHLSITLEEGAVVMVYDGLNPSSSVVTSVARYESRLLQDPTPRPTGPRRPTFAGRPSSRQAIISFPEFIWAPQAPYPPR